MTSKEDEDLMFFSSPRLPNSLLNDEAEKKSPGQNPFDDLTKKADTHISYQTQQISNGHENKSPGQKSKTVTRSTTQTNPVEAENKNPFEEFSNTIAANTNFTDSPFKVPFSPCKAVKSPFVKKRSPLTPVDLNSSFDIGRESLGILPNNALESISGNLFMASPGDNFDFGNISMRESLGILNMSTRESLGFLNVSARDSLGVLNTTVLNDLGRESIGIFDIKNSFRRRTSMDENAENGMENLPEIILSTLEESASQSAGSFNTGFLLTHSRVLSVGSQNMSSISFNYQSLEEPSKIGFLTHDFGTSNNTTDLFNEALEGTEAFRDKGSIPSFTTPATKGLFSSNLGSVRSRIHSLPVTLEEKTGIGIIRDKFFLHETENSDSVFEAAKKVAHDIAEDVNVSVSNNSSGTNEKNFLDATPQPDWPDDLNDSKSHESVSEEKIDKEIITKKVEKMFGMLPNVEEKIRIRSRGHSESTSSENSTNLSRISKTSRGGNKSQNLSTISKTSRGTNKSQNLSRNTRNSDDNVSRLIFNLSQMIDNEDISESIKQEGKNALHFVQNILHGTSRSNESRSINNEADSGHSSVDEQQLEEQKHLGEENNLNANKVDSPSPNAIQIGPGSKLPQRHVNSPASSKIAIMKTPNSSMASNNSQGSNDSKNSYTSGVARYQLTAGSQRKSSILPSASQRGPLKAVIPIESMAKSVQITSTIPPNPNEITSCTPPRRPSEGLRSKNTSTPIQEPKLKPMAASTPATVGHPSGDERLSTASPLSRSNYSTRSSSLKESLDLAKPKNGNIAPKSIPSLTKYSTTITRRFSSIAEDKSTKSDTVVRRNSISGGPSSLSIFKKSSICESGTILKENCVSKQQNTEIKPTNATVRLNSISGRPSASNTSKKNSMYSGTIVRRSSVSEGQNTERKSTKSNTIVRRNSLLEGQNTKAVVNKSLARLEKGLVRRNSVNDSSEKAEPDSSPQSKRSFSTGSKDTKIMSALLKVRQNILSSPYYTTKTQSSAGSSQKVLTENNKIGESKSVIVRNSVASSKRLGKENFKA